MEKVRDPLNIDEKYIPQGWTWRWVDYGDNDLRRNAKIKGYTEVKIKDRQEVAEKYPHLTEDGHNFTWRGLVLCEIPTQILEGHNKYSLEKELAAILNGFSGEINSLQIPGVTTFGGIYSDECVDDDNNNRVEIEIENGYVRVKES